MSHPGFATEAGTERYRSRRSGCHPSHFRRLDDLWAPSVGLGTYLGDADTQTDYRYAEAIEAALAGGCHLLDAAANYRCQRSERIIGRIVDRLIRQSAVARDEIILCTKVGYLAFDGEVPVDPGRYFVTTLIEPGIVSPDEVVAGCHCLSLRYLDYQLQRSLENLGVETIDVYYLHNPEQQLDEVARPEFLRRLEAAFAWLEQQAQAGRIRRYGLATWHGFRVNPQARNYLSLETLVQLAQQVAGAEHHFRAIQLPYNLATPEAHAFRNQSVAGEMLSPFEAAERLGVSVIASASLLQSQLAKLPESFAAMIPGLRTDAQRAIQFARSTPGLTTALVGMKAAAHVAENLEVAAVEPLGEESIARFFTPRGHLRAA